MKKLIEVSLKSIIFFIGWAICASVIPIPDIDNAALWRFFAELIPFLAIVVMSVIFWFVDRKKTKLHLTQRPVYSSVLGGTVPPITTPPNRFNVIVQCMCSKFSAYFPNMLHNCIAVSVPIQAPHKLINSLTVKNLSCIEG